MRGCMTRCLTGRCDSPCSEMEAFAERERAEEERLDEEACYTCGEPRWEAGGAGWSYRPCRCDREQRLDQAGDVQPWEDEENPF